jgi:hypothetical protein
MSCPFLRTAAPPCLPLCVKDSLKEYTRLLFWELLLLGLLALALGLLAFWCGRLLEGKRIAKGKLLKGNC